MWIDNVSELDILNYSPYCDVLQNIIEDIEIDNTTIGLYGNWGSGKSTILSFFQQKLDKTKYACININAWVFEGYEDIKSALIKTILDELEDNTSLYKIQANKIKDLKKKINFLQLGANVLPEVASLALNLAVNNIAPIPSILTKLKNKIIMKEISIDTGKIQKKLIKESEEKNQTKNVRMFRNDFEETLKESKLEKLIIIIDDLDRCTPERIIDCLEAIKLFLSVNKVIFIIAVDNRIIEYSVQTKYPNISEIYDIQKDYLDKIIQIPIQIHQLIEKDISNYLFHLVLQQHIRKDIFQTFLQKPQYRQISTSDMSIQISDLINLFDLESDIYKEKSSYELLIQDLNVVNEIRGIISSSLNGNPRQAKKFLNSFYIRRALLQLYFVDKIELAVLAKLMALEIIDKKLYITLNEWVNQSPGKVQSLEEITCYVDRGEKIPDKWNDWNKEDAINWLKTEPKDLYIKNLSKYFYLSKRYSEGISIICCDCGKEFIFIEKQQDNHFKTGITSTPSRCADCANLKREERNQNRKFDNRSNDNNRW